MNDFLAFITENFWLILIIITMIISKREIYAICILSMLITIGMQPILFWIIVIFSLIIPAIEIHAKS
jgi:hypothetical protein